MVLQPDFLSCGVDPAVGLRAVAVHVPPGPRDATVAHQVGDLVGGLREQGPEVPLHVVVAQPVVRAAFLRSDEVLELHRVLDEEDRGVVADEIVVAFGGVELDREPARVPPGVGGSPLPRHGREPNDQAGRGAGLEHRRLGELAYVVRHLEPAECAAALGVRLPLRDPLPVELGHLLDQVAVLEQDRAAGADGQRMLVALDRDAGIVVVGLDWSVVMRAPPSWMEPGPCWTQGPVTSPSPSVQTSSSSAPSAPCIEATGEPDVRVPRRSRRGGREPGSDLP